MRLYVAAVVGVMALVVPLAHAEQKPIAPTVEDTRCDERKLTELQYAHVRAYEEFIKNYTELKWQHSLFEAFVAYERCRQFLEGQY